MSNQTPEAQRIRCPQCGREVAQAAESFPFCSRRCRLLDLGAWIDGRHVIASRDLTEDDLG